MNEKFLLWTDERPVALTLIPEGRKPIHVRAAGTSFRQGPIQEFRARFAPDREILGWLWPELTNPYHPRAIRLMAVDPLTHVTFQAGYLPRAVADEWFPAVRSLQLESGSLPAFKARFTSDTPGSKRVGFEMTAPDPREWMESWQAAA